jgi:hypothetical protein
MQLTLDFMETSKNSSICKQAKFYQVEIVENIECHFVATAVVQDQISDLRSATLVFLKKIEDLKLADFNHLCNEYANIFGVKPTDNEELTDFYNSATAGVCVNVVNDGEILLSVRFEFDFESVSLKFSCPEIDVSNSYRDQLSDVLEKLKAC